MATQSNATEPQNPVQWCAELARLLKRDRWPALYRFEANQLAEIDNLRADGHTPAEVLEFVEEGL